MTKDRDRIVDVRQAALWLGCSPSFIMKLSTSGWLEPLPVRRSRPGGVPARLAKFKFSQLEVALWDISYSLSPYDVVAARRSDLPAKEYASERGLPVRVIELVRKADVFMFIQLLCERYAGRRKNPARADVDVPFPPDPATLPKLLPSLAARNRTGRQALASFSPGRTGMARAKRYFGRDGAVRPGVSLAPGLWTWRRVQRQAMDLL